MDYEKKYKDAVSAIKFLLYKSERGNLTADKCRKELESIIPELIESEDERTGEEIIDYLKERKSCESYGQYIVRYDHWIAWLEKQSRKEMLNNDEYQTVPVETLDRLYAAEEKLELLKQGEQKQQMMKNLPIWKKSKKLIEGSLLDRGILYIPRYMIELSELKKLPKED